MLNTLHFRAHCLPFPSDLVNLLLVNLLLLPPSFCLGPCLQALQETEGFALVDVRPPDVFAEAHPAGAINVPMYQPLDWSKPSLGKVLKFVAYSSNGVTPVEPNPQFSEQMKQVWGHSMAPMHAPMVARISVPICSRPTQGGGSTRWRAGPAGGSTRWCAGPSMARFGQSCVCISELQLCAGMDTFLMHAILLCPAAHMPLWPGAHVLL